MNISSIFHKKFYHPGNSYILLYGDADLDKELEFIDAEYLANYDLPKEKNRDSTSEAI